ncbi:EAL domain-containing protein [Glaciecola sp. SC05]|uniref:bifunctional diguanylate cyclase/phosphodiesterase n=1 Tax=Glaciecola sp. SC05 TaxID=1987355 RepID=UPI003528C03F
MANYSTFRLHILKLVLGVLAFSSVAILVNVWITTTKTGQTQVFDTLNVGEGVLKQVFANRESQLINSAQVLTADFGFKQAVATRDRATIQSVLNNHGARIEADVMALLSLQGTLLSTTINMAPETSVASLISNEKLAEVLSLGGSTFWTVIQGELYQTILLTIDAPTPIAIALVGFKVDKGLLSSFDDITQLHTTMQLTKPSGAVYSVTTLPDVNRNYSIGDLDGGLSWLAMGVSDNTFVSREFALTQSSYEPIRIILSANVDVIFATFKQLQSSIFAIAIGSLALALVFGMMLAKNITRPLSQLVEITHKLANGAYEDLGAAKQGIHEVNQLTTSFRTMQTNIQQRENKIRFQAEHDITTGLFNLAHIGDLLSTKFDSNSPFQVVGISIRGFRQLNDTFGHQNVDMCLQELAACLIMLGGLGARISSHEFLWIPSEHKRNENELKAIQLQLEQTISINNLGIQVKLTFVTLCCPTDANKTESLFRRLNITFDQADKTSQDLLYFNADYEHTYTRRLDIIRHLKLALSDIDSELSMVYQPKLHIGQNKVSKVEALIRWNSKDLGFVPPDEFIEIAEQANLIYQVTQWVIKRVILDVKEMHERGQKVCAAINLSAKDIMQPELLPWILMQLSTQNLPVRALAFELTESDLVSDAKTAAQHLQEYRDAGFNLAIDDFGTGYSSLAYLQKLPVSDIKIDKSFVLNLATNEADQKIVTSIIALAKSFNMKVVAEGIEDKESLRLLEEFGCDWAQGYYICRPVPLSEFLAWIDKRVVNTKVNTR